MGNLDRWSTPKQIKIERKGDPRPLRRGVLKKGERKKGVKARLDELLSSKKTLQRYAEWIIIQQEHVKRHGRHDFMGMYAGNYFDDHLKTHTKLLKKALKDKVITDVLEWWVFKP